MSPPPFKDYEEAIRLYRLGVPIAEIGRQQDPPVSRQTMWNALRRRGVLKRFVPVGESIRQLEAPGEKEK